MPRLSLLVLLAAVALSACGTSREAAPPPMTAPVATGPDTMAPPMIVDPVRVPTDPLAAYDTVRAGRFDNGRMFTLDDPPRDYLRQTYGFDARRRVVRAAPSSPRSASPPTARPASSRPTA